MHSEPTRARASPVLAHTESQRVGEGARGGEPKVLPHAQVLPRARIHLLQGLSNPSRELERLLQGLTDAAWQQAEPKPTLLVRA